MNRVDAFHDMMGEFVQLLKPWDTPIDGRQLDQAMDHLCSGRKVDAIKALRIRAIPPHVVHAVEVLRSFGMDVTDPSSFLGLKEAKEASEWLGACIFLMHADAVVTWLKERDWIK